MDASPLALPDLMLGGLGASDAEQGGEDPFSGAWMGTGEDGLLPANPLRHVRLACMTHHSTHI